MTVPEDPASIDFSHGQEEAELQIKLLCTRLLAGWANLQTSDMQVSPISGGISNQLVKVEPPPPLQAVAVKVFGDKTELLIDREAEKRLLLRLNGVGFGAPVIGLFGNGRIERFLLAKTLTPDEMSDPRFIAHIAPRLRAFHDLRVDHPAAAAAGAAAGACAAAAAAAAITTGPLGAPSTDATAFNAAAAAAVRAGAGSEELSQWDALFGWLAMAERLTFAHDSAKQASYDKVDFAGMRAEVTALREVCNVVGSPRVLCHNDLLSGNILVVQQQPSPATPVLASVSVPRGDEEPPVPQPSSIQEAQQQQPVADENGGAGEVGQQGAGVGTAGVDVLAGGELQFIDFEYSCYGPRGFDWGNHFNEYAGFDCEYDRFPSAEQQKVFFRHYLNPGELRNLALQRQHPLHSNRCNDDAATPASPQPQLDESTGGAAAGTVEEDRGVVMSPAALAAAEEAVLDRLGAEACVFALASHAYWGVWSLIQARYSPIDFDYLDYSRMRWAEYYRRRDGFFALAQRLFPAPQ